MKTRWLRSVMVATVACAAASESLGAGYFNMPTDLRQCLGVGFGPGYHAPMLLGPALKAGIEAKRLRRVPAAYAPSAPAWGGAPAAWSDGCAGPDCGGGWESYLAAPHPTLAPQVGVIAE